MAFSHIRRYVLFSILPISIVALSVAGAWANRNTLHALGIRPTAQEGPHPEQAPNAYDFVNSIGVNTHLNYFDRIYGNFPLVEQELRSIGIRHIRDGIHLQNDDYNRTLYERWIELGKLGIRFDAVLDPRSKFGPVTPEMLVRVDNLTGHTIESFEGPNEMDISGVPDWDSVDRSYQKTIFDAVRSMPNSAHIAVIGPSLANAASGTHIGLTLEYLDEGNLHPYPAGKIPSIVFPDQTDKGKAIFGGKQIVFTESGYHNALNDHSDQPAISEQAAAKYIPRLFLEDFARGIPRTYLYEFMDEAPDPGLKDHQMHWGLIRADGTEKPAFAAIKRLIEELNDASEPQRPINLQWSLSQSPPSVHHLLLQKSNGEFDLVLWQEIPSYDIRRQSEIANSPVATTLTIGQEANSITLYEPSLQAASLETYTHKSTAALQIPDHPLVVAIRMK